MKNNINWKWGIYYYFSSDKYWLSWYKFLYKILSIVIYDLIIIWSINSLIIFIAFCHFFWDIIYMESYFLYCVLVFSYWIWTSFTIRDLIFEYTEKKD